MAQRDMVGGAKHTALVLGGWLSLFPKSLSVVYIIFLARGIVRPLDEFHNSLLRRTLRYHCKNAMRDRKNRITLRRGLKPLLKQLPQLGVKHGYFLRR